MQINRDHLTVPDRGRAKLFLTSQSHPSNTLCSYASGHPHIGFPIYATSTQASHLEPQSLEKTLVQRGKKELVNGA